ncbi:MAG: PIN domain-containing protein [Deltaproteobacteria bacterium]|nr:PIN domain-containing protein [Deltaproteobacteria bacterium]
MAVLVDSSVWIAAQKPSNKECLKLKRMISDNEPIYLIRPIQVEVCQGAKTDEDFHKLWEGFLGFEFLEVTDKIWGISSWNYFKCRKKGLTLTTLDCLIATTAKEYRVALWTLDKNIHRSQIVIGFEKFSSP